MDNKNIKAFHQEVQNKIKNILVEFGEGKISTEQFNILYERYSNQLDMAVAAMEGAAGMSAAPGSEMPTMAIRQATTGKAVGLSIYHHRSGTMIETLGTFDLPSDVISPTLNELSHKLEGNEFVEPVTQKLPSGVWIVFMARRFTTSVVIFRNEPSPQQIRELERLHHDFEEANRHFLDKTTVDGDKLARPFQRIVRKKLGN